MPRTKKNVSKKANKIKKITAKVIKRVNNNLIFEYARTAIRVGVPLTVYFTVLYQLQKLENKRKEELRRRQERNIEQFIRIMENEFMQPINVNQPIRIQNNIHRLHQELNVPGRNNVHDNQVNEQSIQIYNRHNNIPNDDTINKCIAGLRRKFINDNTIITVLNQIMERNNIPAVRNRLIGRLNKTELQCLTIVTLNVINKPDKMNYLAQMLRDCLDGRRIVCEIGVVNRIVVALVIDNPDAIPRNFRAELANELQNLAIRIRNNVMNNVDLHTDEQRTNEFRNQLTLQTNEIYGNNVNFNRQQLNEILEPLLEACC